ncbi:SIR2 family protein [Thioalkalivibrio sp. HK1]|uniref:SIR2 family protein n=1 Tax=Thioalkalivibrio sp. HK1 TaxID=1469245 RepID=UPI000470D9B8|nr:SIR2 family protein [Thioalkalivibrio sp. HK1]
MQFIKDGPDIPERLLQAHEEGGVVFFCGAGISRSAGLPDFEGLVKKLFESVGVDPNNNKEQREAIKARQYDTAIGLLEKFRNDRKMVRKKLASILKLNSDIKNSTEIHEALLMLSRDRKYLDNSDGRMRLVTTNYDRLFEEIITKKYPSMERFRAPLLPIPKKSQWNGLVYLHGLLEENPTSTDLERLVISSGDFGLAYLTERWAARFVSELLHNYIVCFVGYSINDPMLRYMMDALAADRLLGEVPLDMFAFGDYSKGKYDDVAEQWKAKNVIPILYRKYKNHFYLRKTLCNWADTYRNGVRGKEQIVVELARSRPSNSTLEDDFVGRMLWALSDSRGIPARKFTDFSPSPSLDWLSVLSENRYHNADLYRFEIFPKSDTDKNITFSMIRRPPPYFLAPLMSIADDGAKRSEWDNIMWQLGCWLVNHIDNPKLLLWLAKQGGQLHDNFIRLIKDEMDKSADMNHDSETPRQMSSSGYDGKKTLSPAMRIFWNLMIAGRVRSRENSTGIDKHHMYHWCERFKRNGLTSDMRLKLREYLTPCVFLHEPIYRSIEGNDESKDIRHSIGWMIVLSVDHVHRDIKNLFNNEQWIDRLPELLSDFTSLLQDTLDLMHELGVEDEQDEKSHIHQPSISKHSQNRKFHDWTVLIDLARDAWVEVAEESCKRAIIEAELWWSMPYPLFRRLALFAAAQETKDNRPVIPDRIALEWLLADSCRWLWSGIAKREVIRLLVVLAKRLDKGMLAELEQAILDGPPSNISKSDIKFDDDNFIVDKKVWLRLAKIDESIDVLSEVAKKRLNSLSSQYPDWKLEKDQRDEFLFWADDIKRVPTKDLDQRDDWSQICRDDFEMATDVLCALAKKKDWPSGRWQEALRVWSEDEFTQKSWSKLAPILIDMPRSKLQCVANELTRWILSIAKTFEYYEDNFFTIINMILESDYEDYTGSEDSFTRAINHPVGIITEALIFWWHRMTLKDDQGFPEKIENIFTKLCDREIKRYCYGRIILAAYSVMLYRVDSKWTESHLLSLFSWSKCQEEARLIWGGFLWTPRLYLPLMDRLKKDFLEALNHLSKLSRVERVQYVAFLIFVIINLDDKFINDKAKGFVGELPSDIVPVVFDELLRMLEGSDNRRAEFWANRITPCIKTILPIEHDRISSVMINNISIFCIHSKEQFPNAISLLRDRMRAIEDIGYPIFELDQSDICINYPMDALNFLDCIIGKNTRDLPLSKLRCCLDAIIESNGDLVNDIRYKKLNSYLIESGER